MPTPRKRASGRSTSTFDSPTVRRSTRISRISQRSSSSLLGDIQLAYPRPSLSSYTSHEYPITLNESGQSVPASFEDDNAVGLTESRDAVDASITVTSASYQQKQHDLPRHLYGLDESDDDVHAVEPEDMLTLPAGAYQTPSKDTQHTSDKRYFQRVYQWFTALLYMCGSLLYLAATAVLCLDVYLLHRLFRGEPQSKMCRFWVLPLILFALLYFLIGGGLMPGHADLETLTPVGTQPVNYSANIDIAVLHADVVNTVTATLRKEMATFRSELETHLEKHITEAISSSEQSVQSSVDGLLGSQEQQRNESLKQLRENIRKELKVTLETHLAELHTSVEQQLRQAVLEQSDSAGGLTDSMVQELIRRQVELTGEKQLSAAKIEWINELSVDLSKASGTLKEELLQLLEDQDRHFAQQLATAQSEMQNETTSFSSHIEDMRDHLEATLSDISDVKDRVSKHDKQIRALEERQDEVFSDIAVLKESYVARVISEEGAQADPAMVIAIFYDELDKMMANSSSLLRLWLSQAFISHEEVDGWKKDVDTRLKEVHYIGGGGLTEQDVKQLIELALDRYSADRIARFDFALENSGGCVIPSRCSKTYTPALGKVSLFGFSLWHFSGSPKVIIQPQVYPGDCWAFEGDTGYATIELKEEIVVTGVTLEHISKDLSPDGTINSAPKIFTVWGLESTEDEVGVQLGAFTYNDSGKPIQEFDVSVGTPPATYRLIQFKFLSNHGLPEYTCIYRVRVHGHQQRK